jgi:hypothetical protein
MRSGRTKIRVQFKIVLFSTLREKIVKKFQKLSFERIWIKNILDQCIVMQEMETPEYK